MKTLLLILVLLASVGMQAQSPTHKKTYTYTYDAAGNRIKRTYALVACPSCRTANSVEQDSLLAAAEKASIATSTLATLRLYPNPVSSYLYIDMSSDIEEAQLLISDVGGNTLYQQNLTGHYWQLDLSLLPAGIYIVHITSKGASLLSEKVVKL